MSNGFVLAVRRRNDLSTDTDSKSPKTRRAPTRLPSNMPASNSPPGRMPLALMPSYMLVTTLRIKGAANDAAQPLGSHGAKLSASAGTGCLGTTTFSPKSANVKFSLGSRAGSSSSTTESGLSEAMTFFTSAASLALMCAVPISSRRVPFGLFRTRLVPSDLSGTIASRVSLQALRAHANLPHPDEPIPATELTSGWGLTPLKHNRS
mmetsp:Transcript_79490/g.233660  ORF Transcript_79490/g.233660 Transcript_79490/m.233660 type:complete len:207 (+) Transcript_79490:372-992(+)